MFHRRLENKVAIITGGANGIGKTIATTYAQQGGKVALADLNEEALQATVAAFTTQGFDAFGVRVNIALEEDVQCIVDDTAAHFRRVDILVNCTGVLDNMQTAHNVEVAIWVHVMDINVGGVMRGSRKVLPLFPERGSGVIINLSSMCGVSFMDRAAQPQEIANIALFLASEESSYINGVVLVADVG